MRVNLEIRDAYMVFPLHLFILRGEDIYYSQVYPLLHFPAHPFLLNSTSMEANRGLGFVWIRSCG